MRTEESRHRTSVALKSYYSDPQNRERLSHILRGRKRKPMSEEAKRQKSIKLKEFYSDPQNRQKILSHLNGIRGIQRQKVKGMSSWNKGKAWNQEVKQKIASATRVGMASLSPETRERIALGNKGKNKGRKHSLESRKNMSLAQIGRLHNEKELKKMFLSLRKKPNQMEMQLGDYLDSHFPGEWEYVGDGKVFMGRKCPDFINESKKEIIELFGDRWHKREEVEKRIAHFNDYGYRTFIIWGHELKGVLTGQKIWRA